MVLEMQLLFLISELEIVAVPSFEDNVVKYTKNNNATILNATWDVVFPSNLSMYENVLRKLCM